MAAVEVLAVFGLLAGGLVLNLGARRWAQSRGPTAEAVRVVGQRRLDATHALWVVEAGGRRLLIGTGRDGPRVLAELARPPS